MARDLGAWALGFVFAPSPRRLTLAAARGLVAAARAPSAATGRVGRPLEDLSSRPQLPFAIGVFGDASAEEIAWIVAETDLDGVQLHGPAGPKGSEVRAAVGRRRRPLVIIQAVPVSVEGGDAAGLRAAVGAAREEADLVLLDTTAAGRFGGSGTSFPWRLARDVGEGLPLLVAGGIGPGNVRTALSEAGAWGVDVSSGVESSPGLKDAGLLRLLFDQVDTARRSAPAGRGSGPAGGPETRVGGRGRSDTDERQEGPYT